MHSFRLTPLRALFSTAVFSGALLTSGCADPRTPGHYDPPAESSRTDADFQAMGGVGRTRATAPSQIQIGINRADSNQKRPAAGAAAGTSTEPVGNPAPDEVTSAPPVPAAGANAQMKTQAPAGAAPTDHPAQRAFLPQAQTFVGTFPCAVESAQCQAQRITLTLGPNGRWRSRSTYLAGNGQPAAPQAEQGCWNVTGDRPARLLLLDAKNTPRAELLASANNVLTVKTYLGRAPTLAYTLTRQPDLDSIDELAKQALPTCD
jgi:hypothetical protein